MRGEDLTGKRFGRLVVLGPTKERIHRRIVWECLCDCGNKTYATSENLKEGKTTHCKQCPRLTTMQDITGKRFGNLTAMYPTDKRDPNGCVVWHCRCDCGNEAEYASCDLKKLNYISCGCRKREAEEKLKDQVTHVADTTVELLGDRKIRSDNTTGVTGVAMYRGRYRAKIHFQKKVYSLGTYNTLEEAAVVRKEAEKCLFGSFLEFFEKWNKKAEADPAWAAEHPIHFSVRQLEDGTFEIQTKPEMEELEVQSI